MKSIYTLVITFSIIFPLCAQNNSDSVVPNTDDKIAEDGMILIKNDKGDYKLVDQNYLDSVILSNQEKEVKKVIPFHINDKILIKRFLSSESTCIDSIQTYCNYVDLSTLKKIYASDVYDYFNIEGYDTELKRQIYQRTSNFQEYSKTLLQLKSNLNNNVFYFIVEQNSVSSWRRKDFVLKNYNINRKGFTLLFNNGIWAEKATTTPSIILVLEDYLPPKTFCIEKDESYVQLNNLPILSVNKGTQNMSEALFVPISNEKDALEIEGNPNICVLILFNPSKMRTITYQKILAYTPPTFDLLTTSKVRLILFDKNTNKIYYDKFYDVPAQQPIKKKSTTQSK